MELQIKTGDLIKDIFRNNWEETFIFDSINSRDYTYQEFFELVLEIKQNLEKRNIKKNEAICSILPNSVELIALYFAALLLEITVVSIDPNRGIEEIKQMCSVRECKFYFGKNLDINKKFEPISNLIKNKIFNSVDKNALDIFVGLNYNSLFTITFTSGSTGIPKGVMHSFNNFVKSSLLFKNRFEFSKNDIFYHNLPLSYIGGLLNLLILPFVSESKIVLGQQFSISNIPNFWDIPIKYSVTTFWFIPTIIGLLLKLDRGNEGIEFSTKNKIIGLVGTAALRGDVKRDFEKKYHIKLFESYCLSETFFVTTNYEGNDRKNRVGKLIDEAKISFDKDNEILIETPSMFLGYVGLDNNQFFDNKGRYFSGDLGILDTDGFLQITGRKKDLIIKGGFNISPKKIEDFIMDLGVLEQVVVLGFDDLYMGEKIVCFFITKKINYNDDLKAINKQIITRLGQDYKVDEFKKLDSIPRTTSGKVNKPIIRNYYKNQFG